ncbi:MAG: helix-turn-helix transcriptional regulator [Flavobacteriales bacterium]|nr:helix-turn-helix transcriptional regulator [Flavobacteriales bacterium]
MSELSKSQIQKLKKTIPEKVGQRIKAIRNKLTISQTELGLRVGKDRQYVYKIEKGKVTPNITTVMILLIALDISASVFFKDLD